MSGERHPNLLDRALRLFADVKAGEGANVLILAVNVFLLLTAYYILKPLRDGLITDLPAVIHHTDDIIDTRLNRSATKSDREELTEKL